MKALTRNPGETVTQDMGFTFIDWSTGAPLTNSDWYGGPYILVENYDPNMCEALDPTETVTYCGKEYTLDELKKLIG